MCLPAQPWRFHVLLVELLGLLLRSLLAGLPALIVLTFGGSLVCAPATPIVHVRTCHVQTYVHVNFKQLDLTK